MTSAITSRDRTALVTGAAGFIGSHLCEALLAHGWQVIGLDCFTDYYDQSQKRANIAASLAQPGFRLLEADLIEVEDPAKSFRVPFGAELAAHLHGVELVYHLAGQPGVRGSWGSQFQVYIRNNILATQRLLEASLAAGRIPIVYASSSSAYGNLPTMPLREDMPPAPVSPYGVTKLAAEHLCRLYSEVHGLSTISLRLFTVYGPRQRPDMAFRRFLTAISRDQKITVYGDGTQTRDFTFVADVVQAFLLAGARCRMGRNLGAVFNVAGGSRASVNEVLAQMADVTGRPIQVQHLPPQPGDVRATWADTSLIQAELDFMPRIQLREGLARQWQTLAPPEL